MVYCSFNACYQPEVNDDVFFHGCREIMAKTNAERQREYRERNKQNEEFKQKNCLRYKTNYLKKKSIAKKEKIKRQICDRVRRYRQRKRENEIQQESTPYSTQSAETRAVNR
jgi:TPP-dependent pyruvate/acetoin dehydrogenase alpha subunit